MTTRKPPAKGRTTKRSTAKRGTAKTAATKAAAKPTAANDTAPNDNEKGATVTVESKTIDGAPTRLVLEAGLLSHQGPPPAITVFGIDLAEGSDIAVDEYDDAAFRAALAANEVGAVLPREVMETWPDGAFIGLIKYAAEQCRAFEGVNSEALYLALQMELRKDDYLPTGDLDQVDADGMSHLRDYADATPQQLAWVEVFARTIDFLDDLATRFPTPVEPDTAASEPATDAA